jgi:hypothetical protein
MNLVAALIPGLGYLTILVLTKFGKRRGYLDQLIKYVLRSKIWYPGAYEDDAIHAELNPSVQFTSIQHLFDPGFDLRKGSSPSPETNPDPAHTQNNPGF